MSRPRPRKIPARPVALAFALLAVAIGGGADLPEIVRVRVPSAKVSSLFPPGSDLRVLPFDQFEDLIGRAAARPGPAPTPRLARALHAARWEDGILSGRSELVLGPTPPPGPGLVVLDPWSPAVTGAGDGANPRATPDGRLALQVGPGSPGSAALDWRLRARTGSEGRVFSFDLPDVEASRLVLDLPPDLVPELDVGNRLGPTPGPAPGRLLWAFEAARGRINLRLREGSGREPGGCWVEGIVRIDLAATPTNWRGDWTVVRPMEASGPLILELDAGLELVEVAGPRVAAFRAEDAGASTRVVVTLAEEGEMTFPLSVVAIARAPAEGRWLVPSARFPGSVWIGDRVAIRPDAGRVIDACAERQGRRVAARPEDPFERDAVVFESDLQGHVAEITFRRPVPDAVVEVRGILSLGDGPPRLEAATTWTIAGGKIPDLVIPLPAGWAIDRATGADGAAVPWHASLDAGGASRIQFPPTAIGDASKPALLTVFATAQGAGSTGPIDLPRIRPAAPGVRVSDEVWTADLGPGLAIRPLEAEGLAWIDAPAPARPTVPSPPRPEVAREPLAWRWTGDDEARARVEREPDRPAPRADLRTVATVAAGRLRVDWTIAIDATDEPVRSIALHDDGTNDLSQAWRWAEAAGPAIETRPVDSVDRREAGFPAGGRTWVVEFTPPLKGRGELKARIERPWDGGGPVPILGLDRRFRPRGLVAVDVEASARVRVDSTGFVAIDPLSSRAGDAGPGPLHRRAALLVRRSPEASVRLSAEPGVPDPAGGLIREATLTTQVYPGSRSRHRLDLRIANDSARSIALTMPPGSELDRVRRDGLAIAATPAGRSISVALPAPTATRPTCILTLDYRTDEGGKTARIDPVGLLPTCSFGCLSLVWELTLPAPWEVGSAGPGLTAVAPRPDPSRWSRWLGVAASDAETPARAASAEGRAAMLRDLDAIAEGMTPGETVLGDYLIRLDAGRRPVVVDRLSLADAGLGPRSRLDLGEDPGPALATLKALGLEVEPVGGDLLIRGRADAARPLSGEEADRIHRAATTRSDEADRYQSASRWWGESTPRALSVGETAQSRADSAGWRTWRFVSPRWPTPGRCGVEMIDARRDAWIGWTIAAAALATAIAMRGGSIRRRCVALAAVALAGTLVMAWSWPEPSPVASGLARGALAMMAWWAGRLAIAPPSSLGGGGTTRPTGTRAQGSTRLAGILAVLMLSTASPAADPAGPAPIRVVLPYDGPPDPDAKPDRAAMLLADFDRLTRLARPEAPAPSPSATLTAARHAVTREAEGRVMVESQYDLWAEGEGEVAWPLPIGPARDLEATVDGKPTPLTIAADGSEALAPLGGPGAHAIRFRRWVPLAAIGNQGEYARVPINRAAFARIMVARDARAHWVEIPESPGSPRILDAGIEGTLGPVGQLEVRWYPEPRPDASSYGRAVEMAALWDIRPAGNLVRYRLTHDEEDGVSTIRLALDPNLVVREVSIPNLVATRREGTPSRPVWVAHVDPPWPRGVAIEVAAWKSVARDAAERRPPRVGPVGATQVLGTLSLRRPADWSGRLAIEGGLVPSAEASALKAWGIAPNGDRLIPSGTARFEGRLPAVAVASAPIPARRTAKNRVVVTPRPGRLDATIEAAIVDVEGHAYDAEAAFPAGFRILRVEADGLTSWRQPAADRIRLRFDGPPKPDRSARITGFHPLKLDPSRSFQCPIPWPTWEDAAEEPGTLVVAGPTRYPVAPDGGVVVATAPTPSDVAAGRTTFRVERPASLAPIRWTSPPARVDIAIDSDLTLFPASVAWTAAIRCNVSGGPAESLTWTLPTAWAREARLEILGQGHRLDLETDGDSTRWTVVPDRPIWGRARMILRSSRPFEPGTEFLFPNLAPLATPGRGSIGRYDLGIANVSGLPLEVAGSPGLREEDAARHRIEESPLPAGPADRAFQVSGERWSLRFSAGSEDDTGRDPGDPPGAEVLQALVDCSLGSDGQASGRATYELARRPAPFLAVRLPAGSHIPWASVDGRIVAAIRDGEARWLIPIGARPARRACVAWQGPPVPKDRAGRGPAPLILPAPEQEDVPTLVTTSAPGSIVVTTGPGRFEQITGSTWDVEGAERLARIIVDGLAEFDRESAADREAMVADLVAFELKARALDRAEPPRTTADRSMVEARASRMLAARTSIAEATQATGLDDLIQEARMMVGLAAMDDEAYAEAAPWPPDTIRIRRIGTTSYFRGTTPSADRPTGLITVAGPSPARLRPGGGLFADLAIGLGLTIALPCALLGLARPGRRAAWAAIGLMALGLLAASPGLGVAALAIGLIGRAGD
ncbi:hypothetical protein TA3x_003444 [Tundrisphaera sp. TA3]|uniref:hypothetical protein n=1 Tax=Tundrisphaera sp. TA3 TaxID=3435775 RepID=UPI003EBD80E8